MHKNNEIISRTIFCVVPHEKIDQKNVYIVFGREERNSRFFPCHGGILVKTHGKPCNKWVSQGQWLKGKSSFLSYVTPSSWVIQVDGTFELHKIKWGAQVSFVLLLIQNVIFLLIFKASGHSYVPVCGQSVNSNSDWLRN